MSGHFPLLVIGAGPAGLAAATTAAGLGLEVAVVDEQPAPGGQIYRAIERAPKDRAELLGADYRYGARLVGAFRASGAEFLAETSVWSLDDERRVGLLHRGRASMVSADRVIIASGAMERPVPFPGWTLPGVMNAGAAQILLKGSGVVPADGTVIAGSGPLLVLLAWQYLRAGVQVKAVLEVSPRGNLWQAVPRLPSALIAGHYLTRGLRYLAALRRGGVPVLYGISGLAAVGEGHLEAVEFSRGGRRERITTGSLLSHFGLVTNVHLGEAAGCRHAWDLRQQTWRPLLDAWGNSSVPGIAVVGDGAGIGGARSAEHAGRLAGLEAVHALGWISRRNRDAQGRVDRNWLAADLRIRPFLEALHRLPEDLLATSDDATLVCRCEEISAGRIRQAVREGHTDPNQIKFLTRCGMGPCQGRQCAHAVAHIVAAQVRGSVADQRPFRVRPPLRPLSIAELAGLEP